MKGLYAIVDPEHCAGRDPIVVASAILRGGCAALQLRAKQLDDQAFVALGRQLAPLCSAAGVPLFVNDRVWLVQELGAQGVHLGQTDTPIAEARRALGSRVMIGRSTHTLEQARAAEQSGADLIGFGPIFATSTKPNAEPTVGVAALAQACRSVRIPVIAIGGITAETAGQITQAGAPLAAVIRAICAAGDPAAAAAQLHATLLR